MGVGGAAVKGEEERESSKVLCLFVCVFSVWRGEEKGRFISDPKLLFFIIFLIKRKL